jgi:hypothetical protein
MHISHRARVRLSVVSIVLTIAACSSVQPTYVPDGRRGFVVACGGFLNTWSSCLVKAGRACGNEGYETVKGNEEDRAMMIACKAPHTTTSK